SKQQSRRPRKAPPGSHLRRPGLSQAGSLTGTQRQDEAARMSGGDRVASPPSDDRDHRRPGADGRQPPLAGRPGDRRQPDAAGAVEPPRQSAHRLAQRLRLQRPVGARWPQGTLAPTMANPVPRRAGMADRSSVLAVLDGAFREDPVLRWLCPEPEHYPAFAAAFFGSLFDLRVDGGEVWVIEGAAAA